MSWRRLTATAAVLATAGLVSAPAAQATFHEMMVREVFPGTAVNAEAEYVELQMWAPGQNLVGGHIIRTYDATGTVTGEAKFAGNVTNGANQSTLLATTQGTQEQFFVGTDATLAPVGGGRPAGMIDPAGGAVCWESLDCVTWGSFSGSLAGLSPAGTPAPPIPSELALQRSIAPGCATLLEPGDDRDNSAMDFAAVVPQPRPNAVAPTETTCTTKIEPPPPPPQAKLVKTPPKRSHDRTPTFRFSSNQPGATFKCRIDRKPFRPCHSPYTAKPLSPGRHRFSVFAIGKTAAGSPATYAFTVLR
jgi:hypothetical protein